MRKQFNKDDDCHSMFMKTKWSLFPNLTLCTPFVAKMRRHVSIALFYVHMLHEYGNKPANLLASQSLQTPQIHPFVIGLTLGDLLLEFKLEKKNYNSKDHYFMLGNLEC